MPPAPSPTPESATSRRAIAGAATLLALAAVAAYHNTFAVPLLFDDFPSITDNPTIQHLWQSLVAPPNAFGMTVSGRPVLNFSLALNHAVSGTHLWSYHALNLLIHIGAGLALFGIVRRTLQRGAPCRSLVAGGSSRAADDRPPAPPPRRGPAGFLHENAYSVALAVTLLWTLHPLQTEAVTYLIQRTESLMGLFLLLTLYCFIRGICAERADASGPRAGRASWVWFGCSVGACLLGVGTKEVAATAPVLVLLYDRTFVAGSFGEAWRRRRWTHLALAATWIPLVVLVASTGWNRGGTAGFDVGVAPWAYWLTQFEAVVRYLGLAVWPHPLVFEYGTHWVHGAAEVIPFALVTGLLVAATLVALARRPVLGFLGAWFFAILAPTSVIPGTIQMIVEHRMYLPLAAVLALAVGTAVARLGRRSLPVFFALAAAACLLTERRNADYRDDLTLWQDTERKSPSSGKAQSNLGLALYNRGRLAEAIQHDEWALRLEPNLPSAHYNLGLALVRADRLEEAAARFREACQCNPRFYPARYELGMLLTRMGRPQEALEHFAQAARVRPNAAEIHCGWGIALLKLGRVAEATGHFEQAVHLRPAYAEAEANLGVALLQLQRGAEAVEYLRQAVRHKPDLPEAQFNLGLVLGQMGQREEARARYAEAVRLDPQHAEAQLNLGVTLAQAGQLPEALPHLEQAVRLKPGWAEAHGNLGIALAAAGRTDEAVAHYEEALRLRPAYPEAHYNLGNALLELGRLPDARAHFEAALQLDPRFAPAREMLDRLRQLPR